MYNSNSVALDIDDACLITNVDSGYIIIHKWYSSSIGVMLGTMVRIRHTYVIVIREDLMMVLMLDCWLVSKIMYSE